MLSSIAGGLFGPFEVRYTSFDGKWKASGSRFLKPLVYPLTDHLFGVHRILSLFHVLLVSYQTRHRLNHATLCCVRRIYKHSLFVRIFRWRLVARPLLVLVLSSSPSLACAAFLAYTVLLHCVWDLKKISLVLTNLAMRENGFEHKFA